MGDYVAQLGGSRILNATRADQSGADDTNVTDWVKTNDFILAINIYSDPGKDTVAAQYKLKWRALPGGTFADMVSTGAINYSATTDLVDGASIAVGGRKCSTQGYTWQAGEEVEGSINSDSIDLAEDYETEIHFALDCSGAADNTEYEFELWDDTKEATRGLCGATIKMEAGAVTRELVATISSSTLTSTSDINILRPFTSTIATTTATNAIILGYIRELIATIPTTTSASTFDVNILREIISTIATSTDDGPDWMPGYSKRKHLVLTGGASGAQTDFQLKISVSYEAAMDGDFDDLRFTQADGTTLVDAWAEVIVTDTSAVVWVEFPTTPANTVEQTYYMYYGNGSAASDWDGDETFEFFDDFESGNCEWSPYAGNPILSPEGDEDLTAWGSVWKDGSDYHMFYSYNDVGNNLQIGHATSSDGKSWTKDSTNNPILVKSGSGWDDGQVWDPAVWKEESTWYMLYTGRNSGGTADAIGLATASNPGGTWTKEATNPVLEGTASAWDENSVENMNLMKIGSTYYLWYNTLLGAGADRKTGLATSTNLTSWSKDGNNPIFGASGGYFQAAPFKYGSYYYLLISHYTSGSDYGEIQLYRDTNPTFYSANRELVRIVKPCSISGWDSHDQDTPCVLTTDINRDSFPSTELWTYYAGEYGGVWKTGLLIETDIPSALTTCLGFSDKWTVTGAPSFDDTYVHHGVTSAEVINGEYLTKDWAENKQWALSVWFYNTQSGSVGQWVSVLNNLGNRNAILINNHALTDNHIYYRLNGGSDTDSSEVASVGWHKFEIKSDGTDTKLYFDDVYIATDTGHGHWTKIEFLGNIWASTTSSSWFDELIVRKYATNPPTYEFGAEQSAPSSIDILRELVASIDTTTSVSDITLLTGTIRELTTTIAATTSASASGVDVLRECAATIASTTALSTINLLGIGTIDTENKRRAAMSYPWNVRYPVPDSTIGAADRRHIMGYYRFGGMLEFSTTIAATTTLSDITLLVGGLRELVTTIASTTTTSTSELSILRELTAALATSTASSAQLGILRELIAALATSTSTSSAQLAILRELTATLSTSTSLSQIDLLIGELRELATTIATTTGTSTVSFDVLRELTATSATSLASSSSMDVLREITATVAAGTTLSQIELVLGALRELTTTISATTATSAPSFDVLREITGAISTTTASSAQLDILRELASTIATGTTLSQIDLLIGTLRELSAIIATSTSTSTSELNILREMSATLAAQSASTASINIMRELQAVVAADTSLSQIELIIGAMRELATTVATSTGTSSPNLVAMREFTTTIAATTAASDISLAFIRALSTQIATGTDAGVVTLLMLRELSATVDTVTAASAIELIVTAAKLLVDTEIQSLTPEKMVSPYTPEQLLSSLTPSRMIFST